MLKYKKIKEVMKEKGLSVYELAKLTGINESLLGRYLKGRTDPGTDNVKKISETLQISIGELI